MTITISSILGNGQKLDGGSMFGNAPRAVWSRWLAPDDLGRVELACRAMLIEKGDLKILCETGIGCYMEPKLADRFGVQTPERHILLESLSNLDIKAAEINYVILSHLHFDHAGGLLAQFGKEAGLVFPKAKFLAGREAWERALHPHKRDRASFIPGLTDLLENSDRLSLIGTNDDTPADLQGLISFRFTHGHTPGQMHTVVHGTKRTFFFAGDLIPGTPWVHVPITMGYDRYPEKLIDEKEEIYSHVIQEGWEIFYTHDISYASSQVELNDKGRFTPKNPITELKRIEI